jgi:hypothetical protein
METGIWYSTTWDEIKVTLIRGSQEAGSKGGSELSLDEPHPRYPHAQQDVIKKEPKNLLDGGIIRPSKSPINSQFVYTLTKMNSLNFGKKVCQTLLLTVEEPFSLYVFVA